MSAFGSFVISHLVDGINVNGFPTKGKHEGAVTDEGNSQITGGCL